MTAAAIVYSFAVAPDLPPVVGAPSFGVLARQIPRLAVGALNQGEDRGLRFFPLLGPLDGRRQFFMIPELLAPEQLGQIHGQKDDVRLLVDGRIEANGVRVRIHEAAATRELFDELLPMDPLDPYPVVQRLMFEISGALEWPGTLPKLPPFEPPDLSYFLVAKDDLLSLEAGFEREGGGHWLQAVKTLAAATLDLRETRELVVEISRRLGRDPAARAEVVAALVDAGSRSDVTEFLGDAALLLQQFGAGEAAEDLLDRIVGCQVANEAVALRLAGHLFRRGRHVEGCRQLELALEDGLRTPRIRAQLMVFYQRVGREDRRRELALQLGGEPSLPATVARAVCSELMDLGEVAIAVEVAKAGVAQHPENAPLSLELGRAHMHAGASVEAVLALQKVLATSEDDSLKAEASRLLRFVDDPGVLEELSDVDRVLAEGNLDRAHAIAQGLTERRPDLAEGWLFLGITKQRKAETKAAIAAFSQALVIDPGLGEAHNRAGILQVGLGEHEKGFAHLRDAVRLLPMDSGPWLHFAQACSFVGKRAEGRAALDRAEQLGASAETVASVRRAFFAENG